MVFVIFKADNIIMNFMILNSLHIKCTLTYMAQLLKHLQIV